MTSVPPPGRSLIVWKMANGTTMLAARSSRLRVSTHSSAGRCRQETYKSPSTRWNHALVTQRGDGIGTTSIVVSVPLWPGVSVCYQHRTMTFTYPSVQQVKVPGPSGRDLAAGLAGSPMTCKLKQNKGTHSSLEQEKMVAGK